MDPHHQDLVAQFSEVTGANPSAAQAALESNDWNLEQAVALFLAADEPDPNAPASEAYDDQLAEDPVPQAAVPSSSSNPTPAQPSSSSRRPPGAGRPKQMTLDDLKKMQDDGDDSDDDKKQDMFAGGEKSGLAVQNPDGPNSGGGGGGGPVDHFRNIMSQARQNRDRPPGPGEEDEPPQQQQRGGPSNFTGRAQTLGGDEAESQVIEDPLAAVRARQQALPRVTRTLHLWADGVSIDDGPLFRFDDPANQGMMAEINRGRAPMSLLDVQPGQEVDLNLVPHKDENYVAPKKQYKPFSGQGQRLGSPTPGVAAAAGGSSSSTSTATASSSQQPSGSATSASQSSAAVTVDESAPTLQLQIRLGDGSRLQSRFNTSHTIGDVYTFVDSSSSSSGGGRAYVLMTTFPSKELSDKALVLGELSDFKRGGVVVQKYT